MSVSKCGFVFQKYDSTFLSIKFHKIFILEKRAGPFEDLSHPCHSIEYQIKKGNNFFRLTVFWNGLLAILVMVS